MVRVTKQAVVAVCVMASLLSGRVAAADDTAADTKPADPKGDLFAASFAPPSRAAAPEPPGGAAATPGPWRTVGWVGLVGGGAAVAGGAVFGILAIARKGAAGCASDNVCSDFGAVQDAKTDAGLSTGFVVGGAAAALAGLVILFTHPSSDASPPEGKAAAWLTAHPVVDDHGGGVVVGGAW
jgi:hypothetical protein